MRKVCPLLDFFTFRKRLDFCPAIVRNTLKIPKKFIISDERNASENVGENQKLFHKGSERSLSCSAGHQSRMQGDMQFCL